jgi:hypothetical protein
MIVAGACQWSGAATINTSTALSSRMRRKSVTVCGALPVCSFTALAHFCIRASSTSQIYAISTPGSPANVFTTDAPRLVPINPTTTFWLAASAARAFAAPRASDAAPTAADCCKNVRRVSDMVDVSGRDDSK